MRFPTMYSLILGALGALSTGCGAEHAAATLSEVAAVQPPQGKQGKQDKPGKQGEQPGQDRARQQFLATLAKEGIALDPKQKTVTIPVTVNAPTNELEFLLIHPIGKKHEALLLSHCKPSMLKAALMALGLKDGQNASFKPKKPAPTQAELEAGVDPMVLVPPSGPQVYMTVTFEQKGKPVTLAVEALLHDWEANSSVTDVKWIYLGGREDQLYRNEPPVFMADFEGNLISTCYKHPHNHLITIEHQRARDDMNWSGTAACPPPGTDLKLTFHVSKPAVVKQYEERMRKELASRKDAGEIKRKDRNPARQGQEPPRREPPPVQGGKKK